MNRSFALASVLLLASSAGSQACDITIDPKPSWEKMIDEADVVFVGKAVEILPVAADGWGDRVVFQVEVPVKGELGEQFEAEQGANSCMAVFNVGRRVIFAGESLLLEGGKMATYARDSGWDPTVYLDDPPTPEQLAQLDYLKTITEERHSPEKRQTSKGE